jgi:hypothetical protein
MYVSISLVQKWQRQQQQVTHKQYLDYNKVVNNNDIRRQRTTVTK